MVAPDPHVCILPGIQMATQGCEYEPLMLRIQSQLSGCKKQTVSGLLAKHVLPHINPKCRLLFTIGSTTAALIAYPSACARLPNLPAEVDSLYIFAAYVVGQDLPCNRRGSDEPMSSGCTLEHNPDPRKDPKMEPRNNPLVSPM